MTRRDGAGLAVVLIVALELQLFRIVWFEPRAIGLRCLHGAAMPLVCTARSGLGWLTHYQVFGGTALVLGVLAIRGAPFVVTVAAVCAGIAGVIDYNISWGMLGAALGGWAWLRQDAAPSLAT